MATNRVTDTNVDRLFVDRWSPRAFDGSTLSDEEVRTLFDAARWAPSAYNYQPWRFLYARKGDANFDRFINLLWPFNRDWAKEASLLIFFVSDRQMGENSSHSHSFDTGAAWMQLALQAAIMGLHTHGMTGVEFEAAKESLGVPEGYRIEAAAAVGRHGDVSKLPEPLQAKEVPSGRKSIDDVAFAGNFPV